MGAFKYFYTTRPPGGAVPSAEAADGKDEDLDSGKAQPMFEESRKGKIDSNAGIDVYIYAYNSDDDTSDTVALLTDL
jgi:hypothetical protein